MSKHSIMRNLDSEMLTDDSIQETFMYKSNKKHFGKKCSLFIGIVLLICFGIFSTKLNVTSMDTEDSFSPAAAPMSSTAGKKNVISIPSGIVKANPFVPYRKIEIDEASATELINDVPKYDLISPPEALVSESEAAAMMNTTVSGILYDKYSPTAILNINGSDYLVKKGDTINNYSVISIEKDKVTVKTGKNTYTAGIGELITDGSVNNNNVSNLNKKFGGEKR